MIGLDSSAIIDFFKGDISLKNLLLSFKEPLAVNQICYLELMFGLDLSNPKYIIEEVFYDNFFDSLTNFNFDILSSKKANQVWRGLKKGGKMTNEFDCIIAAIYLTNGVDKIITRNVKHFEGIKELKVISY